MANIGCAYHFKCFAQSATQPKRRQYVIMDNHHIGGAYYWSAHLFIMEELEKA